MILDYLFSLFAHDIGIDLGTANTLVWVKGRGIVIREPSVVARHKKTKEIIALGDKAKKMIGKTPLALETIRPLKDGVIADFDATEAMLTRYTREVHQTKGFLPKIPKPRVVIGIPSGVTEVERRAVQEVALAAGARRAYIIEEAMAAAIGLELPIESSDGLLLMDIGGGTTEMAVISLGGIVLERCLRVAGDELTETVQNYFRLKYSLLLGEATSENIKIQLGSVIPQEKEKHLVVRGRDLETGLPKSLKISSVEVREALAPIIRQLVDALQGLIEETPPELIADIVARGVILCGGGALLAGLDKLISEETKMPVWVADDPMTCVVRGCGRLLEDNRLLDRVRVTGGLK
jgi:rod shape-determining protein MreB